MVPEPPPASGRLGRFLIVETVGQGAMGVVYRGYDPALDRRVALKVLRAHLSDMAGTVRLAREAQAMARLAHPNVVPVYDVGRTGASLFVAMEFVQGVTLQRWLSQRHPWREVLAVCVQAGRGLEAAHAAGIIHRDFKPANVLVGSDGRARVTDFGLARSNGDLDRPSTPIVAGAISLETPLTIAGSVMGTPGYMAPEQYVGQESTPATDQYAFCTTLYEALYGQRPFVGADLQTMARLTQEGAVPPPKSSSAPAWLFPIIARGLSPNPAERHPSMGALLELLERDPSVRRRRLGLTAAALVITLATAAGLQVWPTLRASSCHRETDRLGAGWNDEVRQRIERAFLATGAPFAPVALEHVRTSLDGFMKAWVVERHRACDDTLRTQTHTERQLSLRLACLENRRVELQTLATTFQQADVEVVIQSQAAVSRLTSVERCSSVELLEQRSRLPDAIRAQAEAIEQRLAEGRMLVALGRYDDARSILTATVGAARALGDPQTLALATLELGNLERKADVYAASKPALEEALRLALTAGDDVTALRATALMVSLVGWRLEEPKQALAIANVGRGLVPRVSDPVLEALLEEGTGDARWANNEEALALAAYERALSLRVQHGQSGLDVARLQASIGWILMEKGELSKARAWFENSKRTQEALLGTEHPTLGPTWNELGQLGRELDDWDAAQLALRRAYDLRVRTKGAQPQVVGTAAVSLAYSLVESGQLDEAGELLRGAAPVLAPFAASTLRLGQVRVRYLIARGDFDAAVAEARGLVQSRSDDAIGAAECAGYRGLALAARRDDVEAAREFERAASVMEGVAGMRRRFYVGLMLERVRVLERLKSPQHRAIAEKTQAAALQLEGNSRFKARASLLLAQALLADGALEQARAAAAQAITFAVEPDQAPLKAQAGAFLAAHPLQH